MTVTSDIYEISNPKDIPSLRRALVNRLIYSIGKDPVETNERDWFFALAYVVRDLLTLRWMESMRRYYLQDAKRVYYLSMEFLIGRSLVNSLLNIGCYNEFKQVLEDVGLNLDELAEAEEEAALGNGGLGRLAACYLDSLATLQLPGFGYGIRYEFGMFSQSIEDGYQVEHPDNWLRYGNPWEFARPDVLYRVQFRGRVVEYRESDGEVRYRWIDTEDVMAMAYDIPVPGYGGETVNNLRLWAAKASRDFELKYFNEGNYIKAVEQKTRSENLSKVLYPDDTTQMGRQLRLKQEYFFVSASLQDILKTYSADHRGFAALPQEVAVQLNDTHPSIAIPELMRILMDEYRVPWHEAWNITVQTFSYTNHTLLPEALEVWSVRLFEELLPRHLHIIYEINYRFLKEVSERFPGDLDLIRRVSVVDEEHGSRLRMSHLAIIGSHKVNGVAELHSRLMKTTIFRDFDRIFPDRFVNITNGITPRRWLNQANRDLAALITESIGSGWVTDLERLRELAPLADDAAFRERFRAVKLANKTRLAALIDKRLAIRIDQTSLFDVQVKRIHEYKRQLLNVLHVITRYNRLRSGKSGDIVPRTVIFGGKAAPGYHAAKLIIKLINDVAKAIDRDPAVDGVLKVVFVPDYNVSRAMEIIPAVELSEQISTAGMEASGTGNMKMAVNGAITIGTLDGANIEIREHVGEENIFIFGHTAGQLEELRRDGYDPWRYYRSNDELKLALDMIATGYFSPDEPDRFKSLVDSLLRDGDKFAVLADYGSYVACQEEVDRLYRDPEAWTRKAILNVAHCGWFSSDRAVREYAERIWDIPTCR
ncbi:glycogen/starch/alpha-glucan phosphorylase [Methylocaldum szegediense]|uniref:Alpha-1,4 glucan phosphorylase n=1 Tax=Methylocaldum szegediense TaxID=73780 RepID=A0ABM9HWX2_9GAMM|nr:glycogen/starch/alpha-glucan phosphorylase [Methylocaldum szegediense]CAI8741989.1 glycogen phosphorylase [Methylocaldum szegediense]